MIQQYSDYFYNFTMAIIAFAFIISIFSFLNTFNLCVSNIIERKKEYAVLEAIGMTPKQLKKMQSIECSLYDREAHGAQERQRHPRRRGYAA